MSLSTPVHPPETPVTIIDAGQLQELVSMEAAIEASRRAFLADVRDEVSSPLRSSLSRGRDLVMPADHVSGSAVLKVINVAGEASDGRVRISGVVLWFDAKDGRIAAMADGASITALRTGAASGLATQLLARPDSSVLAMLGAGGQAASQISAVCAVRPIVEVLIHSRHLERSRELASRLSVSNPRVAYRAVETAGEAVRGADVVCSATRSQEPLFDVDDLGPHVHVNAVGSYRPDMREIAVPVFARADLVVVDQREAVLAEAGDLLQALHSGAIGEGDLVELGRLVESGGRRGQGITVFKSVGIAAQDWALMELVVHRARASGLISGAATPPADGSAGPGDYPPSSTW